MSFISKMQRRGIVYTIAIAFNRLVPAWLFRYTVIDVLEIDNDMVEESPFGYRDNVRQMTTAEERKQLQDLTLVRGSAASGPLPLGFAIAKEEVGRLIGGLWIGEQEHYEPSFGFTFLLPDDAGWLFAAMLQKEHRGKGDYNDLLAFSLRKAKENGKRQIFLGVSPCHKAAVHAHSKFSCGKVGRVYGIKLLNWAWVTANGNLTIERNFTWQCQDNPGLVRIQTQNQNRSEFETSADLETQDERTICGVA